MHACRSTLEDPTDEFAVLLDDAGEPAGVEVAERIIAAIREPFLLGGREAYVAASVGVAGRRPGCTDPEALLSSADVAMYQAKRNGKGQVVVFQPVMEATRRERSALQADLRRAVGTGDITVRYQPVVRIDSGEPVGVEALLRWTHPVRGPVPPDEFIPLAEETGVIRELGAWMLRESAQAVVAWRRTRPGLRLNVNVSTRQVTVRSFPGDLAAVLDRTGLPGAALTLELTETALIADPEAVLANLVAVRRLGVRISIDDFGTGYSSLVHLRRFPIDEIKIDKSFVGGMRRSADDLAVVRAVIDLARSLRLATVAEGVEDAEQVALLRRLGCPYGQGFGLAPPVAAEDLPAVLDGRHPARSAA